MSIWDDISSAIGGSGGGWGSVIGAGLNLIGTGISTNANNNAASTVAQGNEDALNFYKQQAAQSRQDMLDARAQATGTLTDANAKATGELAPAVAAGQPARSYLQQTMTTDPSKLTPAQQLGLQDLTRQTMNNLSVSGMRGAGYGGQAVLGDATQRYLAGAQDTNRARSDAAAGTLNAQGFAAGQGTANADLATGSNMASTDMGAGSGIANIGLGVGQQGSNLTQNTAGTNASADLANARALTSGIGSIGQYIDQNQRTQDPYPSTSAAKTQASSDVSSGNPMFAKGGMVPRIPPAHMIPRRSPMQQIGA